MKKGVIWIVLVGAILVFAGGFSLVFAGYAELTQDQKDKVVMAAEAAGRTDYSAYYDERQAEIINAIPAQVRADKIRFIRKSLGSVTDTQIDQIIAVINQ